MAPRAERPPRRSSSLTAVSSEWSNWTFKESEMSGSGNVTRNGINNTSTDRARMPELPSLITGEIQ